MAKKLLNVATFGLAGALLKPFGGKKKDKAVAAAPEERVMPLPDDEAIKRARMATIARSRGRSGRSSTILTGGAGSTLGG